MNNYYNRNEGSYLPNKTFAITLSILYIDHVHVFMHEYGSDNV